MVNKESLQAQPDQFGANFGKGKEFYNRAVDKLIEANAVQPTDKEGLHNKLQNEGLDLFRQSIPYFNDAIKSYDNLDAESKGAKRADMNYCLNALNTMYVRLDMYDELKPIKVRIEEFL